MQQTTACPAVGIIGTGAIAGYYGLMLARAGVPVRFLARSDHAELAAQGLHLSSSALGELHQPVDLCSDMGGLAGCQWILVATKTTANAEVAGLLAQLPDPAVNVVLLQNGFAVEDELRPLLPPAMRLFAGLCFICYVVSVVCPGDPFGCIQRYFFQYFLFFGFRPYLILV